MPGGLIQLAVYGGQDYYLTSNPQISFFKSVYRRHTNFSMESINLLPTSEHQLAEDSEVDLVFTINRHGDLVKDMYFVFELPNIYSDGTKQFQWIKRIGEYIIKEVSFYVGTRLIDRHYPEWLHITQETSLDESKIEGYNRMIGNINELYDPKTANSGTYPASTSIVPSIIGRKVYVPLQFWFNKSYGSALPLIAMQYDAEPSVHIKLRKLKDLYTLIVGSDRIKPSTNSHNLGLFLSHGSSSTVTSLDIRPSLETNYIFLDRNERKRFALTEHEYLIKQINRVEDNIVPNTIEETATIELRIQHPSNSLNWIIRRSDLEAVNQWSNLTNWPVNNVNPIYDQTNPFGTDLDLTIQANYDSIKNKNLMVESNVMLNGIDRFDTKDTNMFTLISNYQHNKRIPEDGIYVYSFGLENEKYQPSGTCNMSRFNRIQIKLKMASKTSIQYATSESSYNYNLILFNYHYNVFRIQGGLGDVEFSN